MRLPKFSCSLVLFSRAQMDEAMARPAQAFVPARPALRRRAKPLGGGASRGHTLECGVTLEPPPADCRRTVSAASPPSIRDRHGLTTSTAPRPSLAMAESVHCKALARAARSDAHPSRQRSAPPLSRTCVQAASLARHPTVADHTDDHLPPACSCNVVETFRIGYQPTLRGVWRGIRTRNTQVLSLVLYH